MVNTVEYPAAECAPDLDGVEPNGRNLNPRENWGLRLENQEEAPEPPVSLQETA